MSSVTPFETLPESPPASSATLKSLAVRPVRFVAFWTGVLAPLAYPPLLYGPLDGQGLLLALVFVANVAGLLLGRSYGDSP